MVIPADGELSQLPIAVAQRFTGIGNQLPGQTLEFINGNRQLSTNIPDPASHVKYSCEIITGQRFDADR